MIVSVTRSRITLDCFPRSTDRPVDPSMQAGRQQAAGSKAASMKAAQQGNHARGVLTMLNIYGTAD